MIAQELLYDDPREDLVIFDEQDAHVRGTPSGAGIIRTRGSGTAAVVFEIRSWKITALTLVT